MRKKQLSGKILGIASLILIPLTAIGIFSYKWILIAAPLLGLILAVLAFRNGKRKLGNLSFCINAVILIGVLIYFIVDLGSKNASLFTK